jgi:nicotinamidase-related amidase
MVAMSQALLLMDLQPGVLDRFAAGADHLDRVVAVQQRAEEAGLLVVLVRVGFAPGHPEVSARNRGFAALKRSGAMVLDTPSAQPHPRLLRGNGEVVVTKKRISAFAGSDLELVLRAHDVTRLALAGVATSGVVLSTVREAADRDYQLSVLEDLCLDGDEEVHRVLMDKVFPRQADVLAAADWQP